MKNKFSILLLVALPSIIFAQAKNITKKPYFQQDVAYTIDVKLDDAAHTLTANLSMTYKNNSPDELKFLYFHLWPNAYRDINTAFAKQKDRLGDLDFHFSKESDKGSIDNLQFKINGADATMELDAKTPDIAVITPMQAIKSGETVTITTPFVVHLPYTFSRGGHVEQAYQITQWYPKPAVYDREGWHPIPYLDQGEFYSEYGTYNVNITLPKNYVVAATGSLTTPDEQAFLEGLAKAKNPPLDSFPESEKATKTINYTATNVHDFAWFADKRFAVRKGMAVLPSGKKLPTWAYFYNDGSKSNAKDWEEATKYISRAVEYYSDKVGEYAYPCAQAVRGALKAGGGMEYPTVTVISSTSGAQSLDGVIMHEVGHNWFYGMLGSNERDHPWMDEGMNSYIESRYMDKYYAGKGELKHKYFTNNIAIEQSDLVYRLQAGSHKDQACDVTSDDYSSGINYYLGAYGKPTKIFRYLESYLGTTTMDKAMHNYFMAWQGKHPQPADVQASFEATTKRDLTWFFNDLIKTTKRIDYKMEGQNKDGSLRISNKGDIVAPFNISAIKDGKVLADVWYDGFTGTKDIMPIAEIAQPADHFVINENGRMPELARTNNVLNTKNNSTAVPFRFKAAGAWDNPNEHNAYFMPALAWNNYDKTMLGVAFYSSPLPSTTEWSAVPMYAFGSKQLVGIGSIEHHIYVENSFINSLTLGLNAQSFDKTYSYNADYFTRYSRLAPKLSIDFSHKNNPATTQQSTLTARMIFINEEYAKGFNIDSISGKVSLASKGNATRIVNDLQYTLKDDRKYNPYNLTIQLTHSPDNGAHSFVQASIDASTTLTYKKDGDGLYVRGFVGKMLVNQAGDYKEYGAFSPYGFSIAARGENDTRYDQYYFGRNDNRGIWSQQVGTGQGGFKLPQTGYGDFGYSTDMVATLNLKAALPFKFPVPIKPYFDAGYYAITAPSAQGGKDFAANQFVYQGGLMLDFGKGIFSIHAPLFQSENINSYLYTNGESYLHRITFTLDLLRLNPRRLIKGLKLG
jgi:hypothetical protein